MTPAESIALELEIARWCRRVRWLIRLEAALVRLIARMEAAGGRCTD
jgi:hypothetical protein